MDKKVNEVMTRDVEIARPDMTVQEAAEMMKAMDLGSLPVCENDRIVGMITDRDIAVRVAAEGKSSAETTVGSVMTRGAHTVREDEPLEEAERIMHDRQLRRLPVVDAKGKLVGYLSQAKIARTEDVAQAGRVLKGISQPAAPPPMSGYEANRRRKTG